MKDHEGSSQKLPSCFFVSFVDEEGQLMQRLGLLALVFLLSCTFNSGAAQEVSAERAAQLFKQGSYKEAAAMFNALLAKNSSDEPAQHGLMNVLVETGDYAQAE